MGMWDHIATDLKQVTDDTDGPSHAVTITVPGQSAEPCRVFAEERPSANLPGESGNTNAERILAITISRLDFTTLLRQTTALFASGPFAGTWKMSYIEGRTNSAWVGIFLLDKTLGVHGAGVRP